MLTSGAFLTISINKSMKCHCSDVVFDGGIGGTSKLFLTEAIKALIANIWPANNLKFATLAMAVAKMSGKIERSSRLNAGRHELELYHLYNFCEELLTYQQYIKYKKKPQC